MAASSCGRHAVALRFSSCARRTVARLRALLHQHLKFFNVVRATWRAVVGELGGNVDLGRWKGNAGKSATKCAAYISKYCLKAYTDGETGSKRYRAWSVDLPPAEAVEIQAASPAELSVLTYWKNQALRWRKR